MATTDSQIKILHLFLEVARKDSVFWYSDLVANQFSELHQMGLVQFEAEKDPRYTRIKLTPKGKDLSEDLKAVLCLYQE